MAPATSGHGPASAPGLSTLGGLDQPVPVEQHHTQPQGHHCSPSEVGVGGQEHRLAVEGGVVGGDSLEVGEVCSQGNR